MKHSKIGWVVLILLSSSYAFARGGIQGTLRDKREDKMAPPPTLRKSDVNRANTVSSSVADPKAESGHVVDLLEVIKDIPKPNEGLPGLPKEEFPEACPKVIAKSASNNQILDRKPCHPSSNASSIESIERVNSGAQAVVNRLLAADDQEPDLHRVGRAALENMLSGEMERYLYLCRQIGTEGCAPSIDNAEGFTRVFIMNGKSASASGYEKILSDFKKTPEDGYLQQLLANSMNKMKTDDTFDNKSDKNKNIIGQQKQQVHQKAIELHGLFQKVKQAKEQLENEKYRLALGKKAINLTDSPLYQTYLDAVHQYETRYATLLKNASPLERDLLNSKRFRERVQGESPLPIQEFNNTDWEKIAESAMKERRKRMAELFQLQKELEQSPSARDQENAYRKILSYDPSFSHGLICQLVSDSKKASALRDLIRYDHKPSHQNTTLNPNSLNPSEEFRVELMAKFHASEDPTLFHLLASNQIQRAYWHLWESGKKKQAEKLESFMQDYIEKHINKKDTQVVNLSSGANASRIVIFPNGIKGIFKPFDGIDRSNPEIADSERGEALSYQLDQMAKTNLVPLSMNTSMIEDGKKKKGSFQLWVEQASPPAEVIPRGESMPRPPLMRAFYVATGNNDDHDGNVMKPHDSWRDPKKFISIDNAKAFSVGSLEPGQVNYLFKQLVNDLASQQGSALDATKREIKERFDQIRKNLPKMIKENAFHENPEYSRCHGRLLEARLDCVDKALATPAPKSCPEYRQALEQSPECKDTYPKMLREAESGGK